MIKILLILLFCMALAGVSFADDFDYTGNVAQIIDNIWFPSTSSVIGGPGGDDVSGAAQQFTISTPTNISSIYSTPLVYSNSMGTTTYTYDLYSNSTNQVEGALLSNPVPLENSLVLQSAPISVSTTQQQYELGENHTETDQVDFSTTLQPGTYWISEQGEGPVFVATSQTYVDPPISNTAQTPEGTPLILFMGLLMLVWVKGRDFVSLSI